MKTIKLINRGNLIAVDAISTVLKNHSANGITAGEMIECGKILEKLKNSKDELLLEDAEYKLLMGYWLPYRWPVTVEEIAAIETDLKAAVSS